MEVTSSNRDAQLAGHSEVGGRSQVFVSIYLAGYKLVIVAIHKHFRANPTRLFPVCMVLRLQCF